MAILNGAVDFTELSIARHSITFEHAVRGVRCDLALIIPI